MSFKFDQEYVDFLHKYNEEFFSEGFPAFSTVLNAYLEWVEGNALCDCGQGCRDTVADQGAKLVAITKAMSFGASPESLDVMALKDPKYYVSQLHEQMWNRAKSNRESKDAPKD